MPTSHMPAPITQWSVARSPFLQALKSLKNAAAKRQGEEAILSFEGGSILIELGGGSVTVPAHGICSVQLRVPGQMLLNLNSVMPVDDPLLLSLEGAHHLRVGSVSLTCHAQPVGSKVIDIPVNAEPEDIVRAMAGLSYAQIEQSGLLAVHSHALSLQQVSQAAALLAPFGITELDLLALIDQKKSLELETLL